jgi:hypothetical protein
MCIVRYDRWWSHINKFADIPLLLLSCIRKRLTQREMLRKLKLALREWTLSWHGSDRLCMCGVFELMDKCCIRFVHIVDMHRLRNNRNFYRYHGNKWTPVAHGVKFDPPCQGLDCHETASFGARTMTPIPWRWGWWTPGRKASIFMVLSDFYSAHPCWLWSAAAPWAWLWQQESRERTEIKSQWTGNSGTLSNIRPSKYPTMAIQM